VHLIDYPVAEFNGRKLIPTDPIVVIEAIIDHDEQGPFTEKTKGDGFGLI
jgi:hypothetical protein